jgi:hypothetical protein
MLRGFMSPQLVDFSGRCLPAASEGVLIERPLEWYKVVGIELVLLVGTLVPILYGALLAR